LLAVSRSLPSFSRCTALVSRAAASDLELMKVRKMPANDRQDQPDHPHTVCDAAMGLRATGAASPRQGPARIDIVLQLGCQHRMLLKKTPSLIAAHLEQAVLVAIIADERKHV